MVPQGQVWPVDYVVYVKPDEYFKLSTDLARAEVAREIGKLNAALADERFICVGPGRWGSSNSDLGVPIAYGDAYHALALVELAGQNVGLPPEPSLGTHFFQDLLESQIYPLALQLDSPGAIFNTAFFESTPNHLEEWLPGSRETSRCLRLIMVTDYLPGTAIKILMHGDKNKAIAFLVKVK
jgi:hypothetical protein